MTKTLTQKKQNANKTKTIRAKMKTFHENPLTKKELNDLKNATINALCAKLAMYHTVHDEKHKKEFIHTLKKAMQAIPNIDVAASLISLAGSSKTRKSMEAVKQVDTKDKQIDALCEKLWDDQSVKGQEVFQNKKKKGFMNWLVRNVAERGGKLMGQIIALIFCIFGIFVGILNSKGNYSDCTKGIVAIITFVLMYVSMKWLPVYGKYKGNQYAKEWFAQKSKLVTLLEKIKNHHDIPT